MKNSVEACIEFSFKGENHTLRSTIDLDLLMKDYGELPPMHALLAKEYGIDSYSYQYEVMLEEEIEFSNPRGLAVDFLKNGHFDGESFAASWQQQKLLDQLRPIAHKELGIEDLDRHEALKNALLQAYRLGKDSHTK